MAPRSATAALVLLTCACGAAPPSASEPKPPLTARAAKPAASTGSPIREVADMKGELQKILDQSQAPASGPASNPASSSPVVVRVAGSEFRFENALDEFLFNYRSETLEILKKLAGDRILGLYATEYGITLDAKELDEGRATALQNLKARVETEFGKDYTLEAFCEDQLQTSLTDYDAQLTRSLRKTATAAYVVRYDAVKNDRVVVRHIVTADLPAAEAVLAKVRQGADFAATARQASVAPTKAEGGKIPPFDKGFDHPITAVAFSLPVGAIAGPIEDARGPKTVYHVLKVIERLPASNASFADLRESIRQGLLERPIERFEFEAFMRKAERRYPVEILGRKSRTGEAPRVAPKAAPAPGAAPAGKSP